MAGQGGNGEGQEEEASRGEVMGCKGEVDADERIDTSRRNEDGETGRHCGVSFSDFRLA